MVRARDHSLRTVRSRVGRVRLPLLILLALLTAAALAPAALAVDPWSTGDGSWLWQNPAWDANTIRDQTFLPDGLTGYQVGNGGLILKTTDGGGTWRQSQSGTLANLTSVSFTGADGCAVGAHGTVIVTADAGATWTKVDSGTESDLLGVHFAPDGLSGWAVGFKWDEVEHGDRSVILKSTDGGASWSVQKANIPGAALGRDVARHELCSRRRRHRDQRGDHLDGAQYRRRRDDVGSRHGELDGDALRGRVRRRRRD